MSRGLGAVQRHLLQQLEGQVTTARRTPNRLIAAEREAAAIRVDAQIRVDELRALARRLLPDRDDPWVLSELTGVLSQLAAAERAALEPSR